MVKHRLRNELTESNNEIDLNTDEIAEQQKMTNAELEQKTTRILKLIQNKDEGKSRRIARDSNKETEVVGLVEDLYNNYQSIYEQYGHLRDEAEKIANSSKGKEKNEEDNSSSSSSSNSDSEYFSSEETNISNELQNDHSKNSPDVDQIEADELEKQVDSLRWELDSLRKQKRESENRKEQEISENMNVIANLKEQLAERFEVEKRILEEKEKVVVRIKDLETELNAIHNTRREIEEHNIRIRSENQWLSARNSELEIARMEQKTEDGIKLGQNTTEIREAENKKLRSKIMDQERVIRTLKAAWTKMEEIAGELRSSMEDKMRALSQRVVAAEQLHKESRSNFRARKKRYEEEKRELEQKVESHEAELRKVGNMSELGMEGMARRLEEESGKLASHISWITKEVTQAKYWVRSRKAELRSAEMMVREKVWNLEAKVRKMESMAKGKDEQLFRVAEEKREAIPQLCLLIDHHRNRYHLLKAALLGKNVRNTIMI